MYRFGFNNAAEQGIKIKMGRTRFVGVFAVVVGSYIFGYFDGRPLASKSRSVEACFPS